MEARLPGSIITLQTSSGHDFIGPNSKDWLHPEHQHIYINMFLHQFYWHGMASCLSHLVGPWYTQWKYHKWYFLSYVWIFLSNYLPPCLAAFFSPACLSSCPFLYLSVCVSYCQAVTVQTQCWCDSSTPWRLCPPYINHQPPSESIESALYKLSKTKCYPVVYSYEPFCFWTSSRSLEPHWVFLCLHNKQCGLPKVGFIGNDVMMCYVHLSERLFPLQCEEL